MLRFPGNLCKVGLPNFVKNLNSIKVTAVLIKKQWFILNFKKTKKKKKKKKIPEPKT